MRRAMFVAIVLALVVGVGAATAPAQASCAAARAITSSTPAAQSYVYTPGNPFALSGNYGYYPYGSSTTYYANGVFWAFGYGNPVEGLGIDSGIFKGGYGNLTNFAWFNLRYFPYPNFMGGPSGHWQIPGIDGCITESGSDPGLPDPSECMIVHLEDFDGPNGFHLTLGVPPNAAQDFEMTTTTGFAPQLILAPKPKPIITDTAKQAGSVDVTVIVNKPTAGVDLKCGDPDQVLLGYKIYARKVPTSEETPTAFDSRAIEPFPFGPVILPPWEPVTPAEVPYDTSTVVSVSCGDGDAIYLGATMVFGGVEPESQPFESKYASTNSTRIECGPTSAHPDDLTPPRLQRNRRPHSRTSGR